MWGGPPVRLDIYSISLFLEGSVEDTPGFGIGSVRTIPRERPSTMMERRECVCEARASHSFRQWLLVTGQCHCWRQQVVQEYGWPQSYNKIRISTTSANGGTYAGQYPCDGWVGDLEPIPTVEYTSSFHLLSMTGRVQTPSNLLMERSQRDLSPPPISLRVLPPWFRTRAS